MIIKRYFLKTVYLFRPFPICFILLLGVLFACSSDKDDIERSYDYFVEVSRSLDLNRHTFLERLGEKEGSPIAVMLPDVQVRVDAIRYRTVSPAGEQLEASGIVCYPATGDFKGVVVAPHFSISADKESPSSVMATIESTLAFLGYVVIAPDYLGFGSTVNLPQPYLHTGSAGQVTSDMVFAVREHLEQVNRAIDDELYVVGYSQGGYSSLAFAKMVQEKYASRILVKKVFAGGGPYDPAGMFNTFIKENRLDNPATVVLTIVGADYSNRLQLDYTRVFQEPLLSNYKEWVVSKKYTLGQINAKIGNREFDSFIHPDIYLAERNNEFNKLYDSLEKNRLTSGWTPTFPLVLFHGRKDKTVPLDNSQKAYDNFKAAGADVSLHIVEFDHGDTAIPFYLYVLNELRK